MALRAAQRAEKRQRLLAAAEAAFAVRGFQGAGVAEIAAGAGMVPANLYRYFAAKEEMVAEVVARQRGVIADQLRAAETETADPLSALIHFLKALTAQAMAPEMRALWLEVLAEAARNKAVAAQLAADDRHLRAAFGQLLQKAVPGCAAESLARQLIALMDGIMARAGFDPEFDGAAALAETEAFLRKALS
jgi:AcrR family transcriptional regulator